MCTGWRFSCRNWCLAFPTGRTQELRHLSLSSRIGACHGSRQGTFVVDSTDAADLELRASHAWDVPTVTLTIAVVAGTSLLRRSFVTEGIAPDRLSIAAYVGVGVGGGADLGGGFYVTADVDGGTYLFREEDSLTSHVSLARVFAVRTSLGIGKLF